MTVRSLCPDKSCPASDQLTFMKTAVPLMDDLHYVYRCTSLLSSPFLCSPRQPLHGSQQQLILCPTSHADAWFISRMRNDAKSGCSLLEFSPDSSNRTSLGDVYHNFISEASTIHYAVLGLDLLLRQSPLAPASACQHKASAKLSSKWHTALHWAVLLTMRLGLVPQQNIVSLETN